MCNEVRKTNNTAPDFPSTCQLATFWVDGVGEVRLPLDSGPDLSVSCGAADDKVKPYNDVTYL